MGGEEWENVHSRLCESLGCLFDLEMHQCLLLSFTRGKGDGLPEDSLNDGVVLVPGKEENLVDCGTECAEAGPNKHDPKVADAALCKVVASTHLRDNGGSEGSRWVDRASCDGEEQHVGDEDGETDGDGGVLASRKELRHAGLVHDEAEEKGHHHL